MKKINSFIYPLFLSFTILFTINDVYASSTLTVGSRVDITVSVTKANVHYQLVRKTGEDFLDDINVKMIKNGNQIIMNESIKSGKISLDRQEFGDYEIIVDENGKYETRYKFTIDEEYLRTQDEIKKIVLNEKIDDEKDNVITNTDKNKDNESPDKKDSKVENVKNENNNNSVENINSTNKKSANQAEAITLNGNAETGDNSQKNVILFSFLVLSSLSAIIKIKKSSNNKK